MAELPTGTVTFLFTDLEGSTRLWEQHPDAMRDALARHDAPLLGALDRFKAESGIPGAPAEVASNRRTLARVEESLEASAFAEAWAFGAA